jgi:hypothetical protein
LAAPLVVLVVEALEQRAFVQLAGVEIEAHESVELLLAQRHMNEAVDPLLEPLQILGEQVFRLLLP